MFKWNGAESYYGAADLDLVGIRQNRAASVMIPEGYEITLYTEDNKEGTAETLYGGFLPQTDQKMICLPIKQHDNTSSLVVRKTN